MASIRGTDRMLSMPIKVVAAGWESDTLTLQQHGWDFYCSYDMHYLAFRMALVHRIEGTQAVSMQCMLDDYVMQDLHRFQDFPAIQIERIDQNLHLFPSHKYRGSRFHAVNMEPTPMRLMEETYGEVKMMEDTGVPLDLILWRPDDRSFTDPAPDVVIKEQSVEDLLGLLKDRFATSDEEYYEHSEAGLIINKKEVQRHLHLVSVR